MAVFDQPRTSYNDTSPNMRVISEVINIIDPTDTPTIAVLGGLDGGRSKFRVRQNGTKIEWLEDAAESLATAVSNGTVAITTNATQFTVADGSLLRAGHVIKIDSEYMVVASLSTDEVTIAARDYGGTNATHATNAVVEIVGMARLEGADAAYSGIPELSVPYNYTSIFQDAFKITGTAEVLDVFGMSDPKEYQVLKKLPRLLQLVEKGCFHGVRAAGSATTSRSFGGLDTFITGNTENASSGAVTKTIIDNLAEKIYLDGGNPDLFICHPGTARDIRAILDTSSFVKLDQMNTQFGMMPIMSLQTQWGSLKIIQSRFCRADKAYMLESGKIGLYTLRPFAWHDLAKTGDSEKVEVVGEVSLIVANDSAHGSVYGIST